MVVYSCKKCGELNYLTPHAYWNIADFGAKCEKGETINMPAAMKIVEYPAHLITPDACN